MMQPVSREQAGITQGTYTFNYTLKKGVKKQIDPFRCTYVLILSDKSNTGKIFVGGQSVDTQTGFPIEPSGYNGVPTDSSAKIWITTDTDNTVAHIEITNSQSGSAYSAGLNASGGSKYATGSITNNVTAVTTSQSLIYGWYIFNSNTSTAYCQIFNNTVSNITIGITAPDLSFGIPAGSAANVMNLPGLNFDTAISIAFTTSRSGGTAPINTVDYNIFHS